MAGIFISYRRKESAGVSGRMFDRLSQHFGAGTVFMDIDSIPIGQDYREHIDATLQHCDLILAVVGPTWTGPRNDGHRRIDDPTDLVRLELEGGLNRKIPVVPVLIENAAMPAPEELPESLRSFAYRNAAEIDSGKDFHVHMDRLIRAIELVVRKLPPPEAPGAARSPAARRTLCMLFGGMAVLLAGVRGTILFLELGVVIFWASLAAALALLIASLVSMARQSARARAGG